MYWLRNIPNPPTKPNLIKIQAIDPPVFGLRGGGGYIPNPDENRGSLNADA